MRRFSGRMLSGTFAALLLLCGAAYAAQTEGIIKSIDKDSMTLTLDDGKAYKLNGEMNMDSLKVGMDIVIAYDVTNGENVITDMELPDDN